MSRPDDLVISKVVNTCSQGRRHSKYTLDVTVALRGHVQNVTLTLLFKINRTITNKKSLTMI
jgi:hypothetical protein